jgi:predicted NUDIX family NTP pyrophosphohydrolase
MTQKSSGLLLYRFKDHRLQVLLVHPGGPFWARKNLMAWSIPKGQIEENEMLLAAARREFAEETGFLADGDFLDLGRTSLSSGKVIYAFALQMDLDENLVVSNKFTLEWPRGSGKMSEFPEIDRAAWFDVEQAREMIHKSQEVFLDRLVQALSYQVEGDGREKAFHGSADGRHAKAAQDRGHEEQSTLTRWSNDKKA